MWSKLKHRLVDEVLSSPIKYRSAFIGIFSVFGIAVLIGFGVMNLLTPGHHSTGVIELIFGFVLIANLILLFVIGQKWMNFAKNTMMISMYIPLFYLLQSGGIGGTGIIWFAMFPVIAFFVNGKKIGLVWVGIMLLSLVFIYLTYAQNVINFFYSPIWIRQLIFNLVVLSGILYFFESITQKTRERLSENTTQLSKVVKDQENTKKAMINVLEDVSEQKAKAEKLAENLTLFKQAVESSSDQIVITDADGIILYANGSLKTNTGYDPQEVVGKKAGVKEFWGGQMPKDFYKKLWHVIKDEKKPFAGELKNKHKSGRFYIAATKIDPVLNDRGDVIYFVAIERDITKEKEVDKAKTEFVSLASHQLRTPLATINWYIELLQESANGRITGDEKTYLDEIDRGSKRMVKLVNALLNVSRIELGTFAVSPEPSDLKKIIQDVLTEVKPQIQQKQLRLEQNLADLGMISVDPELFEIVVENLLTNSIKYTPSQRRIKIDLRLVKRGQQFQNQLVNQDSVMVAVADQGLGIPESQQRSIFQKLFRADNVKKTETEGTGLGLYIVKQIVEGSGGQIWFESRENRGTVFFITIPLSGMKQKAGTKQLARHMLI